MKTFVITISKNFLKSHPKAGEETNFKEMILAGEKIHTIRGNYNYWSNIINQVNAGLGILSVREWSGKPYKSKQVEICQFKKLGKQIIEINQWGNFMIDCKLSMIDITNIAHNDGLLPNDFLDWFNVKDIIKLKSSFRGIIIHFTKQKY